MKEIPNSGKASLQIIGWLGIALITIAAFLSTYYFNFTGPIQAVVWILWLLFTFSFGYLTTQGKQIVNFGRESNLELRKVVWPTRQETIQITFIVIVMVTVTGFFLWGVDSLMTWVIGKITHLG